VRGKSVRMFLKKEYINYEQKVIVERIWQKFLNCLMEIPRAEQIYDVPVCCDRMVTGCGLLQNLHKIL
jgi:hypothetical protein